MSVRECNIARVDETRAAHYDEQESGLAAYVRDAILPMQGVRSKKGFMIGRTGDVGGEADDRIVDLGTQVTAT